MSANDLIERLLAAANDPMWEYHCELSKQTARDSAKLIKSQAAEIERLEVNAIHSCHDQCTRHLCVLRRENESLREAMEPFGSTFVDTFVDEDGWRGPMNKERIVDWFGPSDFRRARQAIKGTGADHG